MTKTALLGVGSSKLWHRVIRILRLFSTVLYLLPDLIFRGIIRYTPRHKKTETLAIIRLDKIGDMVLFAQTCNALVSHTTQQGKLCLLICQPSLVPLVKGLIPQAQLFGLDPQKLWQPAYRYRQGWRLYRFGIQTFFHPAVSHYQYLETTAAILRMLPHQIAIGYKTHVTGWRALGNAISGWHYKPLLAPTTCPALNGPPEPPLSAPIPPHERDYHQAALSYFGADMPSAHRELGYPECKREWAFPVADYIVIAAGASHDLRRWPIGRFVTLVQQLRDRNPEQIVVLIGTPSESDLGEKLRRHTGEYCIDLTGKTSLVETWHLIAESKLVITNETGVAQMGAVLGKKTIALTGGGHWGRFVPLPEPTTLIAVHHKKPCYNCNWQCIHPLKKGQAAPCILDISVEAVLEKIALAQHNG